MQEEAGIKHGWMENKYSSLEANDRVEKTPTPNPALVTEVSHL